jgi:type IV pilus assembly protein PilO
MSLKFDSISEQFQGLDLKDVSSWPAGPKWVLLALLFAAVCALAWYFVIDDKLVELETAQKQEEKLRRDYSDRLKKSVNLQALKEQKVKVTAYVAELEKQLPDKAEMDRLLSDINYAGVSKGLQFELFKPGAVKIESYYAELPINIKLTGQYHKLASFAADVSALSRIVTLNNISLISPANSGFNANSGGASSANSANATGQPLVMEATAKTFRYLDKEEAEKVAKLKAEASKK